jgi:hypothetical protein
VEVIIFGELFEEIAIYQVARAKMLKANINIGASS